MTELMKHWKTEPTERFFYLIVPQAHVNEPIQRQISSGTSFGRLENAQKYFNKAFHSHILKIEISEMISLDEA